MGNSDFKYFKDFVTVAEAAKICGLSKAGIEQAVRRGALQKYRLHGKRVFLLKTDVEAFNTPQPVAQL